MAKSGKPILFAIMLALSVAGCTSKGQVKGKAYLDSNKSSEAFIGYEFPINK